MDGQDYTSAGFDKFLSRGDTPNLSGSLDQPPAVNNNAIPFDRMQVSGALGDTFRIGKIFLDGSTGRMTIADENGLDFFLAGEDV